jgi:hypothetical protein
LSTNVNESPSRRRLVIPLERQRPIVHAAAPKKSRVGKILALFAASILVIILFLAGGVFLWWQHYQTTPAYSLALLVDAAQRNDMTAVDKIVDTDKIVNDFAKQVTDKTSSHYGAALSDATRKQIESLLPTLLPAIKQTVRDGLASRVKELSENANQKPFIVIAIALPYFVKIDAEAETAKASAVLHDSRVELGMQRAENGWNVVTVQDDALVQKIIDDIIKQLPAIGQSDKSDARKTLKKLLNLPQIRIP